MAKKITYLVGILLTIFLGTLFYQRMCCDCCTTVVDETIETPEVSLSGISVPFKIFGDGFEFQCLDNINFMKNDFKAIMPLKDSVMLGLDKLKMHLDANTSKLIKITGYATSDEVNSSSFPNLALARANNMKDYLIEKGFAGNKFDLNGVVKDTWTMQQDTLVGPVEFEFIQKEVAPVTEGKDWSVLKEKINASQLTLYFGTNQTTDNLTAAEEAIVNDIVNYIKNVQTATVRVVGHTDNVGSRDLNLQLGEIRANFVKQYLIKKGVDSSKIEVSSQGPDAPIGDNTTNDGKSKNRRTIVTIK